MVLEPHMGGRFGCPHTFGRVAELFHLEDRLDEGKCLEGNFLITVLSNKSFVC